MHIKQLSIFLENKPGRLASVAGSLRDNAVNIRAMTIADTLDFGILRMIVNKPDLALEVLGQAGFTVKLNTVIAVEIDDREGIFHDIMRLCDRSGLNIEYTYSFVEQSSNKAILFLRFENCDKAIEVLGKNGYKLDRPGSEKNLKKKVMGKTLTLRRRCMAKRIVAGVIAAMVLMTAGISCDKKAQAKTEPIKIGAIFAVTGPGVFLGAPEEKTARMVVDRINARGGINGNKLVLIIKDSQGSPEKAVSFAKQLIEEEKVFAIIGPSTSGETMQIKTLCDQNRTILISCAAAEVIVNPLAKYVFNVPQKDGYAVRKIYQALQALNISRIAVLSSNTGFGKAGKGQLEKIAPEFKIDIAVDEVYEKDATDLTGVLTKVKAGGVGAIVNWSIEPAQAILAKNMKQLGFTIPLFQSHGFGNIRYVNEAGAAAEGIIFPARRLLIADGLAADNPQKAVLEQYKNDYESAYKEDVSTFGGHAYDALLVLSRAIETAGADKEKVRDAIEGLKGLVGVAGVFNYSATDHNGLDMNAFEMLTVKNGRFAPYTM